MAVCIVVIINWADKICVNMYILDTKDCNHIFIPLFLASYFYSQRIYVDFFSVLNCIHVYILLIDPPFTDTYRAGWEVQSHWESSISIAHRQRGSVWDPGGLLLGHDTVGHSWATHSPTTSEGGHLSGVLWLCNQDSGKFYCCIFVMISVYILAMCLPVQHVSVF